MAMRLQKTEGLILVFVLVRRPVVLIVFVVFVVVVVVVAVVPRPFI
jgi:hypothetical protein